MVAGQQKQQIPMICAQEKKLGPAITTVGTKTQDEQANEIQMETPVLLALDKSSWTMG